MGKNIISQARGKGSSRYRVPPRKMYLTAYKNIPGAVVDIIRDVRRSSPIAVIRYDDGSRGYVIAPEGISVGSRISDYVSPLEAISIGQTVFGIELHPNSGPQLCMASGSAGILVGKEGGYALIQLPSKKQKLISLACRAVKGIPAGEGRGEKPFVKAGKKWHAMHARGRLYPRSKAVNMNAVDHPFGGKSGPGQSKSVSRHAPPGAKVGSISPRRTGRRKK
ncbi:MAG: 50S ribosomal protein L2 [Candidatus Aenigmarchaeota archaeon]|nr:50S ribosomal protein L2 [Candidatus Aenigmarchaeota archaeon]